MFCAGYHHRGNGGQCNGQRAYQESMQLQRAATGGAPGQSEQPTAAAATVGVESDLVAAPAAVAAAAAPVAAAAAAAAAPAAVAAAPAVAAITPTAAVPNTAAAACEAETELQGLLAELAASPVAAAAAAESTAAAAVAPKIAVKF